MKKLLLALIVFFSLNSMATHIIGGDISITWISSSTYEVTLQIFRDCSNPTNADFDGPNITVAIYEDITNSFVQSSSFPLVTTFINELGDDCYTPQGLCVETGIYTGQVTVPSPNPNGYYIAWERCCRNASIANITNPLNTGMAFVAYFPDSDANFNPYNNSTPSFDIYPSDGYFCIAKENEIDFNVTDIDGDSLYYSLSEPLAGYSDGVNAIPLPSPQPYPTVNWFIGGGYDANNPLGQVPANISIDSYTGLLSAMPYTQGIFVFGIKVEEFRDGNKIGEIRRELQMETVTCDNNEFPTIASEDSLELLNHPEYFVDSDTVEFTHYMSPGAEFCINISALDTDINDGVMDSVWLFGDIYDFNLLVENPIVFESDSAIEQVSSELCWYPTCNDLDAFNPEIPYSILFTAKDNACRGDNYSYLKLNFEFQEGPIDFNNTPNVFTPNGTQGNDVFTLNAIVNECFDDFFQINIYNRWGKLVYKSNNVLFTWDGTNSGKDCPEGVYFYAIQLSEFDFTKNGFIHLFR